MDLIDNIFDSEIRQSPPLFLNDPDEEEGGRGNRQKDPLDEMDIDAMFADVEDDDDFNLRPLGPSVDTDALLKEAEARHRNNLQPLTSQAIPSRSPPRETVAGGSASKGAKLKETKGRRKKVATLDEGRLLSPDGFPSLIKTIKNFKTKGKGHEVHDLDRLLRLYGYWTHTLYPKTIFKDTVERIEKLCRSRRMNVALSVWRDEAQGNNRDLEDEDDSNVRNNVNELIAEKGQASSPQRSTRGSSPFHTPSRPPSSATEPDDFDIDSMIREEEERIANLEASKVSIRNHYQVEDREGYERIADISEQEQGPNTITGARVGNLDDEGMWDVLRDLEETEASVLDDEFESMYAD